MSDAEREALLALLEYLWAYGADRHPAPARKLNELRKAMGFEEKEYRS